MEPFSAAFLSTLASKLAGNVAAGLTGTLKRQIAGSEAQQAVERCLRVALVALAAQATAAAPEEEALLTDIFSEFFSYRAVRAQIIGLLSDEPLDYDKLLTLFTAAGFEAARLPNLNFRDGLDAFAAAFVAAADTEPQLQGVIQIGQLRRQTATQQELLAQVKELAGAMKELVAVSVRQGQVMAEGRVRPVFQWHIGKVVNVAGANYDMSGDYRQSILNFTTNYFEAGPKPQFQAEKQFQAALENYLRWVKNHYSQLTLRGLERREAGRLTLELEEVYISLAASINPEEDERKRRWARRPAQEHEDIRNQAELKPIDMAQLLSLDKKWVITGGPGSGKSTYLHLVASSIARALLGEPVPIQEALGLSGPLPLPIVVSLGGYNSYRKERKGTLVDYISYSLIEQNTAIGLPDDFFKRLLIRGRACLLLLDGLDEVAKDSERVIVRGKVEQLAANEGVDRVIVTSRTRAYQGQAVLPFRLATVNPMSPEQVRALAAKWCIAAYEPDEAQRQMVHLQNEIEQLEKMRAARNQPPLADTPLMVTIIAIVHDNLRKLPEQRAALYEECVKALLSEHHKAASEEKTALIELGGTFNEKRNVLSQLAFEMMSSADKAQPRIGEKKLIQCVRPLVVRMRGEARADDWLEKFIEAMRERGSLLDERDGEYRFTHLTFQEFLAATYLSDTIGEVDEIVAQLTSGYRIADSWWRETVLLTATYIGLRSPDRALRLLNRLVTGDLRAEGGEVTLSAAELAGVSFLELGSHDQATCRNIASRLVALLTNEHLTFPNQLRGLAGVALGRLGDPRPDVSCAVPATVLIPAGEFLMGSERRQGRPGYDEMASRNESTKEGAPFHLPLPAYRIGQYPVTVAQYRRFVEYVDGDGRRGYDIARYWTPAGLDWLAKSDQRAPALWDDPPWTVPNHPVVGVTWFEAVAYCAWLTDTNPGRFFRLPDEAMWEKAARGEDGRRWPWGPDWDPAKLNSYEGRIGHTSAVGLFPSGSRQVNDRGERIYDCAGNVWEWCSGLGYSSGANYPLPPRKYDRQSYEQEVSSSARTRALRGGAWYFNDRFTRAAYRLNDNPDLRNYNIGFRVAELLRS